MNILLCTIGTRGDVQPMIALGLALQQAGDQVMVAAPSNFATFVQSAGLAYSPICDDMHVWLSTRGQNIGKNPLTTAKPVQQWAESHVPSQFETLLRLARNADMLISTGLVLAAPSVAEAFNIPLFGVLFCPVLVPSLQHPPVLIPWQQLPPVLNRVAWWLNHAAFQYVFRAPVNRARRELGLLPVQDINAHLYAIPTLLAVDDDVAPGPAAMPHVHTTGFWFYDEPTPLASELEAFLKAGPPPIYVGFGSMVTRHPERVTLAIWDAVRASGYRLLLSAGWAQLGRGMTLPAECLVIPPTPHASLFPRVRAVVHHGGAGTTAAALRAGVPQVVVPHLLDQFYWAHRLHTLRLAPPPVDAASLSASRLEIAINRALHTPEMAQQRTLTASRLQRRRGIDGAMQLISERLGRRAA